MGDVKLAGVLGLFLGRSVAVAILAGPLAGALAGVAVMARLGVEKGRKTAVPFGPFLALVAWWPCSSGPRSSTGTCTRWGDARRGRRGPALVTALVVFVAGGPGAASQPTSLPLPRARSRYRAALPVDRRGPDRTALHTVSGHPRWGTIGASLTRVQLL